MQVVVITFGLHLVNGSMVLLLGNDGLPPSSILPDNPSEVS